MSFQYKARSAESYDKRANQSGSQFISVIRDDINTFSAKKGDNVFRILPPTWEEPEHYGYDIWVHFGVGPTEGTVLCPSRMKKQRCPICEFQAKAEADGREDADDFAPRRRVCIWLIDRKAEKPEEAVCVWTMPWTVDRDISKFCKDRETGELYQIDNPANGYDVYLDKSGEKAHTKYLVTQLSRRPSPTDSKAVQAAIDNPIPSVLIWRSYEEIKEIFEGEAVAPKAKEEDPSPKQGSSATISSGGTVAVSPQEAVLAAPTQDLVLTPTEFCSKTMKAGGKTWGCGIVGEAHLGACDFAREVTNGSSAPALSTASIPPVNGKTTMPELAKPAEGTDQMTKLRARFNTGK